MTVDQVLKIVAKGLKGTDTKIIARDRRILISLSGQLDQGNFLTENQANLLLKIFQENKNSITVTGVDFDELLKNPTWSEKFRIIERKRRIFLDKNQQDVFFLEFSYDKRIQNKLTALNAKIYGNISTVSSRMYAFVYCEKNIFTVISEFEKDHFKIDQEILNFYQEICEIRKNKKNPFDVFSLSDKKLQKIIEQDIGPISEDNLLLLNDRKFRYQYEIFQKNEENTLTASIAQRRSTKIFINPALIAFDDIIKSLQDLNRLPVLIIFDGHTIKNDKKSLEMLKQAIKVNKVSDHVGIYFRYDKINDTVGFNSDIATLKFNKPLDGNTTVAVIANNKLPKFMVKMNWQPNTVISMTTNFRNNKNAVYFTEADLTIFYTDKKPLGSEIADL